MLRGGERGIAGAAQPGDRLARVADTECLGDFSGRSGIGAVVADENIEARIIQPHQVLDARFQLVGPIARADGDRDGQADHGIVLLRRGADRLPRLGKPAGLENLFGELDGGAAPAFGGANRSAGNRRKVRHHVRSGRQRAARENF